MTAAASLEKLGSGIAALHSGTELSVPGETRGVALAVGCDTQFIVCFGHVCDEGFCLAVAQLFEPTLPIKPRFSVRGRSWRFLESWFYLPQSPAVEAGQSVHLAGFVFCGCSPK